MKKISKTYSKALFLGHMYILDYDNYNTIKNKNIITMTFNNNTSQPECTSIKKPVSKKEIKNIKSKWVMRWKG